MSTELRRPKWLNLFADRGHPSPSLPIFYPANLCNDWLRCGFRPSSEILRRAFGWLVSLYHESQEFLFNLKNRAKRQSRDAYNRLAALVTLSLILWFFPLVTYTHGGNDTAAAHIDRGAELMQENQFGVAAQEFIAALRLEPDSPEAHFRLGICDFVLGKPEEARQEFEKVTQKDPDQPSTLYYLGRLDLQKGDLDGAISLLGRIASQPPFPDTSFYLGQAYFKRGQSQEALRCLLEASQAAPHDPRVRMYLGRVYHTLSREAESEKAFATSEAMRKADAEATEQGVACDNDLRNKPLAIAKRTCAMLFDPHDAEKLDLLGRLYGLHGMFDLGLEPLKIAVALDPDSYEIQHNLGLMYFRLGKFQDAVGPLEEAVKLRPEFFGSNAVLGASLLAIGQPARSLPPLRQAHRLHPEDQEVAHMLYSAATAVAKDLITEGKFSESVVILQEAAGISPGQPEVHSLLAEAYSRLGRSEEAEKEKRTAEQLSRSGS